MSRLPSLEKYGLRADIYTPMLGQLPAVDSMLVRINNKINQELKFERELIKLRGALDMTLAQVSPSEIIFAMC